MDTRKVLIQELRSPAGPAHSGVLTIAATPREVIYSPSRDSIAVPDPPVKCAAQRRPAISRIAAMFISVVIDNYNYGRFLGRAIDGALAQDYPSDAFEVVVVDDGSTDDSREVAGRYGDRVRLVAQSNQGQAAAFNAGVAAAKGDVVCFLDSDDWWEPGKLAAVAERFADPAVGIVQHFLRDVDASGASLENPLPDWPATYDAADLLSGRAALAATSGLSLRKSLLQKLLPVPVELRHHSDYYLVVFGLLEARAANVPRVLGYHRIHGANNWAEVYASAAKLERSLEEHRAFRRLLDRRVKERGLAYAPLFTALDELETGRWEVLLAAHRGRRGEALARCLGLFARHGTTRVGAFRAATLLLAALSPAAYLRAYDRYRGRPT